MVRRVPLRLFIVVAAVAAACQAQPTGPTESGTMLLDTDEPECVDTVYQQAAATRPRTDSGPVAQNSSSSGCHVVVIWY